MQQKILMASLNNKFIIGGKSWCLYFDRYNQELFYILKQYKIDELWIITGPGSFIGTRSIAAFALGFTFATPISLKGFNILMDILPVLSIFSINKITQRVLYFFQELERFFYCIYKDDLNKRIFFLLSLEEFKNLKYNQDIFTVGNHSLGDAHLHLNFKNSYEVIEKLLADKNKTFNFNGLEYCGKFLI
jgi:tRNA A37 threonylcarbamoyladenosine modification protein TsaB